MKRLLLTTVTLLALAFTTASIASANAGPHTSHGTATSSCVSFHRINAAIGNQSLIIQDTYAMCMS